VTTFVALGDSITLGIGDPVRLAPPPGRRKGPRAWRGWAVLLSETLPDPALHIVAGNGALMADLERDQLPAALQLRPEVASVVIGINDTLRPNFDPDRLAETSAHVIGALRAAGADVLTMRLPDPGRMLHLPDVLARPLAKRAHLLNDVIDQMAERFGTLTYDAAGDPFVYDPPMWAVDRLHPSERGHRLIARRFHDLLAAAGHPVGPPPGAEPVEEPPTRAEQFAWMATKGTVWVARRSTDLVPCLLSMAFEEWRAGRALPEPEHEAEIAAERETATEAAPQQSAAAGDGSGAPADSAPVSATFTSPELREAG